MIAILTKSAPRPQSSGPGGRRFKSSLPPTNCFQSLTILQIRQTEPLVRLLWVPQLKCRFPKWLGLVAERRLGHPIGAPITISFLQNSRMCSKHAGLAHRPRSDFRLIDPLGKHQGVGFSGHSHPRGIFANCKQVSSANGGYLAGKKPSSFR